MIGSTDNDIDYRAEFAHVSGPEKNRAVRRYGFDPGLTKTFKQARLNPRLTAGIAFGSGDNGAGIDTAFRQTDIQGNSGRFGSKTSLKYYGEVLTRS
ncbi:Alginate export [Roseovarius marisflavi]|uniref:Alginate export n=1 Tax=Roseovarius marisflavi TaxID=1054996 RepID=A0A1M6WZE4_9RHOB|nr:alginate export family protein [Roseovarius marisflavi]SHK99107.1 Alginate export [Roseovarius marisflavi]